MALSTCSELRNEIPSTFVDELRARGHTIPLIGNWWLNLARSLVANDHRDLATFGRELADRIDRKQAFDKGVLSRFIKGTGNVTYELVQALCAEFTRLPKPILFPQSYEEAVALQATHERYARMVGANDNDNDETITPLKRPDADGRRRGKRQVAAKAAGSASRKSGT